MTDRRNFISTVSGGGAWLVRPKWLCDLTTTLRVDAKPTVYFSHPDGIRNLVRFAVSGIDAPAGRLRVFDRSRRLLGTMGVLRAGDRLHGELWLELEGNTSLVSELEAPGVRGPFRTTHHLTAERKWTIHVVTVVDPDRIASKLNSLRPINRAVQAAIYRSSSIFVNPLPTSGVLSGLDHIPFLRLVERAFEIEREKRIPISTVAYVPPEVHLPRTTALALAGSGVRILVKEQLGGESFEWWEIPGRSPLLVVSLPDGSTLQALGFGLAQNEMTGRVEAWLASTALRFSPNDAIGTAVVLNSDADEPTPATLGAISAWNSRFAHPRIMIGNDAALIEEMEQQAPDNTATPPVSINRPSVPVGAALAETADARADRAGRRARDLGRVLGSVVEIGASDLEAVAAHVATAVAGTVVFNPSPYARSDLVRMSDGSERLATNIPAVGYAFFPDESVTGDASLWESIGSTYTVEGGSFRVAIDRVSGAVSSLVQTSDGREWVRPQSAGLNWLPNARLLRVTAARLDGVATRLEISRRAPNVGTITTTLTHYDDLPWLCLDNETESTLPREIPYRFDFALRNPQLSWEVPAGYDEALLPVPLLEHLRWICLDDVDGALMFRALDAPLASVDADGTLTSHSQSAFSRYRLASLPKYSSRDMPWVFGWDTEPMEIVRAEPNGSGVMPRFGSILTVEKAGVAVLGISPAADDLGVIVYLQEILGVARTVSVAPGILQFRNAETVDFLERYEREIPLLSDGTIQVPMPANGVVAVRLWGLELSRP